MAESTVGWFGVREKYCSLADKLWLISQIQASEHAANRQPYLWETPLINRTSFNKNASIN